MKKILILVLILIQLTGCKKEELFVSYPEIIEDFRVEDYAILEELSEGRTLSYLTLCDKYLRINLAENSILYYDMLVDNLETCNLELNRSENFLVITFTKRFVDDKIRCKLVVDSEEFKLISLQFDLKDKSDGIAKDILDIIEKGNDVSLLYSVLTDDLYIDNNIFYNFDYRYYLPLNGSCELVFYTSTKYIDKKYVSVNDYFDGVIRENEIIIEELRNSLGW